MKNKKKLILVIALAVLLVAAAVIACLFIFGGKDQRPMVTFQGVEEIHAPVGTVTEESLLAGVTAVDANGKKMKVTIDLGGADLSKPGFYTIEYKAGDGIKREVIYLYGDISFSVNGQNLEGDRIEIPFAAAMTSLHFAKIATATDSFGNEIVATLVEGDQFDYAVGEYTAKYVATDKAGQTVEKTVTYVVTSDVEMTVQSGVSVKYEQESVTFKVDLDGEENVWLMANGGLVSIANYTITENELVLEASYFRTLAPGENTLKLFSLNGSTEFTFTVVDTGKPLFTFDSIYKSNIIVGSPAVYEMPQTQIAGHEYSYSFKVTRNGATYKAEQLGESVVFTTSDGKVLPAGIYDVSVTATNKADTSKKTTIKRDFRIYTNQTEIDGWEFWNAPQAATMVNVDLSDMGYYRTSWKYDAKSTAAWDSRVQWLKASPKTFQSITFDFYVYSLGIAEKANGPVKYVGKNGKADILFNALTMGGENLAFMFYDQNGNVVPQDELKMNTWYTMKLDVSEFSGGETDIFMVSSLNNVRKVGMYITEMHFWAYEGSGAQNIFRDDAKTATIQRNSGKSNFVSATLDDETVWMYSVTEKHMPSTALKRSLKVSTSKSKEVISIDFKFMEDPKDAWGKVLKPTMFVHDLDYPQKDIAYGANYTLVDAETGKPVETPEVGKWYTLYITTKGRENFLIYPMGETKDPVTCKVAFKNLQTHDVDLGNAQIRTDLGNVSRVSLFKNGEGKWQYSYVSYTGWSETYPNDAWRRRAVVNTTGDVGKVTFQFKFELSEYLEAGKEEFVDNFALIASVEAANHPALVTTIYDENGNMAGETDIQIGKWYYAVVTREDGKDIVNPFCLLVGGSLSGGDGNIVNIEMELRDLQGVAPSAGELTVDFDLNYDGAPDYNETLTVAPYTTYGELPVPEQRTDGKYFNGWYKNAECTEAAIDSMLVTESHTLYAKWSDRPLLNVTFTYPDYGTYYAEVFTSKQGTDTIHKYASTMPNDAGRWHEGVYAEYRRVTMNIADELGDTIVMDVMIESVTDVDGKALDTSTLTIYPAGSNAAREVIYTDAEGNPVDANALVVGQWYTATFTGVGAQSYDIYPFALGEAGGGEKGIFYMKNIKLIPGETPDTPDEDDFNPTLRFAITSDTHLFNRYQGSDPQEARLANVFKVSYNYAKQSTYNKLDAVLVAGDISEGDAGEFVMFKDIVDANIQEGTQLIVGMGNHDFRGGLEASAWTEDAAKKLEAAFKETFGLESADQHVVIGGYHFISLSPNAENLGNNVGESYSEAKLAWLEAEIQKAIAEDATKPVFVMQHHHPSGTVYGSSAAGGKQADLFNLLSKYPQVVDFSGHSHYPVNDPRNVWQGAFTAIGTGTLFYVGIDINGGPSGVSPDGYQGDYSTSGAKNGADYGVFQIIEVNADNDIRVIVYDLRSFEEISRFVIPNPVENKDFKIEQAVPEFAEDTDIYYEDSYIYVQQAVSEDIIESYRAEVYEGDKLIGTYYGLSGYVYPKQLQPEHVRIHVGELAENKGYTVKVYAVNVYNELSEALVFVTAEPDTKVIFDLDYEGAPAPEEVLLVGGKVFGTLPRPNRTEYAFGGWFTEKNGAGEQITADTIVEGECTLYAYWFVPTEPKPSFDAVLGTTELSASYGVLPDPTLQYLDEWVYVYDGNAKDYSMYTRFLKITFGNSITENKFTLKAKITNVNGGSTAYTACGSGLVSIFDSEGKTVAENLVNGKSAGLKADEWYTFVYTKTDGSAYKPGDWSHLGGFGAGRADIHIKDVVFEEYDISGLTFEVTFDLNHEGAADPAVVKVAGGKTVGDKLPTPEREGYKFNGWSTSKWGWGMGKAFAADTAVSGNQTVYAMWTIDPEVFGYTFSYPSAEGRYYLNIATEELDEETVIKYSTTSNNHSAVTAYYRRAMLHVDNEVGNVISMKVMAPANASTAATKLAIHNAAGTALAITITNAGGEKVDALVAGEWCTVSWTADGGENYQIRPFDGSGTAGVLYMKDVSVRVPVTCDVTFNLNYEGASNTPEGKHLEVGDAYGELPVPTFKYHIFGGWYTDAACSGEAVTAQTKTSGSHTLYAKWTFDPAAAGFEFTYASGIGTYYGNVTAVEVDGDVAFKHYVRPHTEPTAASDRRVHLNLANTEKQAISMQVYFAECSNTPSIKIWRADGPITNAAYAVHYIVTDAEGNVYDPHNLELNKWYTVTWLAAGAPSYMVMPFEGEATNGTYYMKNITVTTVEDPLSANYYAWPAPFAAGDETHYWVHVRAPYDAQINDRYVVLKSDAAAGDTISFKMKATEINNNGTSDLIIKNASGTAMTISIVDENGNSVNATQMQLNQWYTVSWVADGSATYRIHAFAGVKVDGNYFIKDIISDKPVVETFDVTFDLNYEGAGEGPEAITRAEGAAYGTLPTPTRKYHTFDGWYTDAEHTNAVDVNAGVTADTTLYAKWTFDAAAAGFEFTYASGIGTYYGNVTAVEVDGEVAFKHYVRPHTEPTAASDRRVHLNLANTEKQAISMQVYFAECSNTPSIKIWRADGPITNAAYAVHYIVTDAEGNVYDPHNLELNKWYTVTWLAAGAPNYMVMPFEGEATNGTYYMKNITVTTVEDPLSANYYAWPAPFAAGDETHYWVHVRAPYDAQINDRYVVLKSDAAAGDTISFKMKATEINNNGTSDLIIKNASGTAMTISIVDENGNSVNATQMQLNKWYTVSWVADGSATYRIHAFAGVKVDGNYFIKDIETVGETLDVTFDLNYDGAENDIEKISVEEGAAYGTLPSPTVQQTPYTTHTGGTVLYYSFAGWYKNAECTGETVMPTDEVSDAHTLYAKWDPISLVPRTADSVYAKAVAQYLDGELVQLLKGSASVSASAEQSRLNLCLPETPVYVSGYKVMVKNDSDAVIKYVHNGNNATQIYDEDMNLIFSSAVGGGAGTTIELKEGEWYTFAHAQSESNGKHWDMTSAKPNYWGVGGFGDGTGIVDIYVKDVSIATEAPSTDGAYFFTSDASKIADKMPRYIDGEWVWAYIGHDKNVGWSTRMLKLRVTEPNVTTVTCKIMMNNCTGAAVPRYYRGATAHASIWDENGALIAEKVALGGQVALEAGKWYTFEFGAVYESTGDKLSASNVPADWTAIYCGDGTGGMDVYIKDIEVHYPEEETGYDVTFDLNYEGAGEGPAKISVEKGAAYGTLPTPTRAQTPTTTNSGYTFYYSFAGWYLDADCTGEAVKPTDVVDQARTLYAKWNKAVLLPRATNSVYSDPTLQYIENEWVYVYANNGTARSSAEQERMNLHLPEKIAYAVSYKVMLKNETDAALFYADSGNLGVDVYDPNGNLLYSRNYKNGGTSTQVTLEEGKWYTVVHSNRDSSSHYVAGLDYFGVGAFSDGAGGATVYVKDISIATEALTAGGAYFFTSDASKIADKMPRYIDGEWTWAYIGHDKNVGWSTRMLKLRVTEPNVTTVTCKIMMNNCTGAAVPRYYRGATAHASIWDENGTLIAEKVASGGQVALEAGKWYTFEFGAVYESTGNKLSSSNVPADWTAIYCGDGTGGMDVYIKDIEVH